MRNGIHRNETKSKRNELNTFRFGKFCFVSIYFVSFRILQVPPYELLTNMIFHISVEKNYKSYLSFFGKPEVNLADLSGIFSLREN